MHKNDLSTVTRVEVIDEKGRTYVNWNPKNIVQISMQDDNKTMKIFIKQKKMEKEYFIIMYGLGGGYNTETYEVVQEINLENAIDTAMYLAHEEFESIAGSGGISDYDSIAEEEGYDLDNEEDLREVEQLYNEERDSWVHYWAKPFSKELETSLIDYDYSNEFVEELGKPIEEY